MDLSYTPEENAFRCEVRAWLEKNVPGTPLPSFDTREGFEAHRDWERRLCDAGFSTATWPKEYGGRALDLIQWLIFEEEYYRAKAPARVNQNGIFLLAPTLMEFGTDQQKSRFLPPMARSDEVWAQAWSEPQAGSDLAAVSARAERKGDSYILKGHKIWSSRAVFADWAFGLFRTDPQSKRHKGLSLIFFPLNAPGVTVRPIAQINGNTGFAEIFLDDVCVPIKHRLGNEGDGWTVCMTTAGFERGLMLRSPGRFQTTAKNLVELCRTRGCTLDSTVHDEALQAWMDAEAYALSIYATASNLQNGGKVGPETSCNKIFWSELDVALHRTALSAFGSDALINPDMQSWLDGYYFSLAGPIYAGANEIQRNIIAERLLGLPKA